RADGVRAGGFPGAERIFAQQAQGVASKRVGFLPQGRMPVREGAEIVDAQGRAIGKVSSGGFGPSLNAPLAMGYVPNELAGLGSEVTAMVRGKPVTLVVSKMPFVAQRYYRG
ncbi:glycine cleavage system aminomethyltransferase GcvT, partial [Pseudomonas aeruginosa]|nr:glycine cleavage system aminomethyltransferase GcvT [Pseudomonas aeruginosa]